MSDEERLAEILRELQSRSGLDEPAYRRLSRALGFRPLDTGSDPEAAMTVAFYDTHSYDRNAFEDADSQQCEFDFLSFPLGPDTAAAASGSRAVCIFVNDRCDAETVHALAAEGVELIALRCAGYNNVDLDACRDTGLTVVRVPAYSPHAVAEHTVALMLMLNRRLHHAYNRNRSGQFVLDGLTGFDMVGKTVGVVGTGEIGRTLVKILLGFGCRVLAHDHVPNEELSTLPGVSYVDLEQLWTESHIVSLHVPLFEDTHHLLDARAISSMRDGVMIINTSRGGLIDTPALVAALKSGKVGAAGLDVYEEEQGVFWTDRSFEPLTDDVLSRLLSFPNVVVTSHQGFLTHEALGNIADTTIANIAAFADGRRGTDLPNIVMS